MKAKIVTILLIPFLLVSLPIALLILFIRWAAAWGSTEAERAQTMPGDSLLDGGTRMRAAFTRAVSIKANPKVVWPWLSQLGRGAGWYSVDRLDNGGKKSAQHIISWIPAPRIGDASATGYLEHINEGSELVWWLEGARFLGSRARMAVAYKLAPEGEGSRLVMRVSGDMAGITARPVLRLFQFIDSIMARRQLLGIKKRAENFGARNLDPQNLETGQRDQYQLYQVIYADGSEAGVKGKEKAEVWRQSAIGIGLIND